MNKQLSIYLDLLRFIAAGLVFISHFPGHAGGLLWQLAGLGHEAVVFFFVLSGFVISYVVYDKKERALEYSVNRLTRLYSVAIPALILTVVLYYIAHEINEESFVSVDKRLLDPYWTFFAALFFVNQSWIATSVFSNLPYWSLGYEALYYVFFYILIFVTGWRKFIFIILILAVMGPSIILYLPIWMAGVLCFKCLKKFEVSFYFSCLLYCLSVIGIFILSFEFIQNIINNHLLLFLGDTFYSWLLDPAEQFGADYILAFFVVLHIFSSYHLGNRVTIFNRFFELMIRKVSLHTFSLYLYHMPLLFFVSAIFPFSVNPVVNFILCLVGVPITILIISTYTENRKHTYRQFFHNRIAR